MTGVTDTGDQALAILRGLASRNADPALVRQARDVLGMAIEAEAKGRHRDFCRAVSRLAVLFDQCRIYRLSNLDESVKPTRSCLEEGDYLGCFLYFDYIACKLLRGERVPKPCISIVDFMQDPKLAGAAFEESAP